MWILHVSCSTCGFDKIPMWILHFEVKGSHKVRLGPTNVSLDMNLNMLLHIGYVIQLVNGGWRYCIVI
jgi:hypothetical protein